MNTITEPTVREPLTTPEHPQLLFFDANCSFCARWVARVMAADREHRIRFAPLRGATYQRLLLAHPGLRWMKSVVLVSRRSDGRELLFVRSTAIRKVIAGLPGFRLFSLVLNVVPTPWADLGYRVFSRLREPLFGSRADDRPDFSQAQALFLD